MLARPTTGRIGCYAESRDGAWEAFCLDFDLAVEGESLEEARRGLREAVALYLDHVRDLPVGERRRFIRRRAPLGHWLTFLRLRLFGTLGRRPGYRAAAW